MLLASVASRQRKPKDGREKGQQRCNPVTRIAAKREIIHNLHSEAEECDQSRNNSNRMLPEQPDELRFAALFHSTAYCSGLSFDVTCFLFGRFGREP